MKNKSKEMKTPFKPAEGHAFPTTRREFIAAGLLPGISYLTLPSVFSMVALPSSAEAADANHPGYIEINAAGGAGFAGQVMMLDKARQPLASYTKVGQGPGTDFTQVLADGKTPIFANKVPVFKNSGLYTALNANEGLKEIMASTYMFSMPGNILSDTSANQLSAGGLINQLIGAGKYLPQVMNRAKINMPAIIVPPAPLVVQNFSNIKDAVATRTKDVLNTFSPSAKTSLAKFVRSLNVSQALALNSRPGGLDLQGAATLALDKNVELASDPSAADGFDPRLDAPIAAIWGINKDSAANQDPTVHASIARSVALGHASSGGIQLGGYDYHGNTRTATNEMDRKFWDTVSKVLLTFASQKKACVLYLTSDGSVGGAATPEEGWTGDSSIVGVSFLIVYNPSPLNIQNASGLATADTQIGQFLASQSADLSHVGSSPKHMAIAATLNYANLAGLRSQTSGLFVSTGLTNEQLNQLVRVNS